MCLHVFVGSLLLTETERLFPSLMLSSEVGCQHLCRQRNGEAEKKKSERWKGKAYFFARSDKNKNLRLLTVCPHTISKRRYLFRLCHKSDGCLSGFIQVTLIGLPTMALPKMWAERNFSLGVFIAKWDIISTFAEKEKFLSLRIIRKNKTIMNLKFIDFKN